MANELDRINPAAASFARRTNLLNRISAGEAISPEEQRLTDQAASSSLNEFQKGLRRFGYSSLATSQAFAGQLIEPVAPEFAKRQIASAMDTMNRMPSTLRPQYDTFEQAKQDGLRGVGSWAASAAGEGLPSTALMLAGGLAGRGVGALAGAAPATRAALQYGAGMATVAPLEGGETALQLHNDPQALANTTAAERAALAVGRGTVNAALENIVPQALVVPRLLGKAGRIAPGVMPALGAAGRIGTAGAIGEYGTEGAQDLTGQAALKQARGEGQGNYDWAQANEAGLRGAVTGGLLGGAGGAAQALHSNFGPGAETRRRPEEGKSFDKPVETFLKMVKDPQAFGFDAANVTLDALDEASQKAGAYATESRKATGRGLEKGGSYVGQLRDDLTKYIAKNVKSPELRDEFLTEASRIGTMTSGQWKVFVDNLQEASDNKDLRAGLGASGRMFADLVSSGAKSGWEWTKEFSKGVSEAAAARKAAPGEKQSFDISRGELYKRALDLEPGLGDSLRKARDDERRVLADILTLAVREPQYFKPFVDENGVAADKQSAVKQKILDQWKRRTGTDLEAVAEAVRSGARKVTADKLVAEPLDKFFAEHNVPPAKRDLVLAISDKQSYAELTPVEKRFMTNMAKSSTTATDHNEQVAKRQAFLAKVMGAETYEDLSPSQKTQINELTGRSATSQEWGKAFYVLLRNQMANTFREEENQQRNPEGSDMTTPAQGSTANIMDAGRFYTEDVKKAEREGALDGTTYDEEGNIVQWGTDRSPFDRDAYRGAMVNSQYARRADTTVPVRLSSDQLTARQIAQIFGKKVKGKDGKDEVVDFDEKELGRIKDDNSPLNIGINPMSLYSMVKNEAFRDRFRSDVGDFQEGVDLNKQAGNDIFSALSALQDYGIEIDPEEIGLPPGDPIRIKADVDLSKLPKNLLLKRTGSGENAENYTLADYSGQTRRERSLSSQKARLDQFKGNFKGASNAVYNEGRRSATARAISNGAYAIAKQLAGEGNKPTAAQRDQAVAQYAKDLEDRIQLHEESAEARHEADTLRSAYISGEIDREDIEAVADYYESNTGAADAIKVLDALGLEPVNESVRDEQADRLRDLLQDFEASEQRSAAITTGKGDVLTPEGALDEELKVYKLNPLERENTAGVAAAIRADRRKGGAKLFQKRATRDERLARRKERLRREAVASSEAELATEITKYSEEISRLDRALGTEKDPARRAALKAEKQAVRAKLSERSGKKRTKAQQKARDELIDKLRSINAALGQTNLDAETREALEASRAVIERQIKEAQDTLGERAEKRATKRMKEEEESEKADLKRAQKQQAAARRAAKGVKGGTTAPLTNNPGRGYREEIAKLENNVGSQEKPDSQQQTSTKAARAAMEAAKTVEELHTVIARLNATKSIPKGIKGILTKQIEAKIRKLAARTEFTQKNAAEQARLWAEQYAPGIKIKVEFYKENDGHRGALLRPKEGRDYYTIQISERFDGLSRLSTLAHEFGHALMFHTFNSADAETQAALRARWQEDVKAAKSGTRRTLINLFGNPGSVDRNILNDESYDRPNSGSFAVRVRDGQVKNKLGEEQFNSQYGADGYTLSFEEWFANQFVKHVIQDQVSGNLSTKEKNFWKKAIAVAREFFDNVMAKMTPSQEFSDWVRSIAKNAKGTEGTGVGNKPPTPPPGGSNTPPGGPPNGPQEEFVRRVRKLMGDRVAVIFDQKLSKGVAAEFKSREKRLDEIRESRRNAIDTLKGLSAKESEGKKGDELRDRIAELEQEEASVLADKAVLGTIRVAAGMEVKAGLAEHEAFHAAFEIFFSRNPAERRAVATAFSQGLVNRKLREVFKDEPDVLSVIDPKSKNFDPEEAAAYGFQVWMTDPDLLRVGDNVRNIFTKIRDFIRALFGIMTPEQRAQVILNDLASGRRAERGTSPLARVLDKDRPWAERAQHYAQDIVKLMESGYNVLLGSTYQRLVDTENPMIAQIAKLGYETTGEEGSGGMIQRVLAENRKQHNHLDKVFHGLTDEEKLELHDAMIFDREPASAKVKGRRAQLNRWFKDMYEYQRAAGVDMKNAGIEQNYYPLTWDAEKVMKDKAGFLAMLAKYEDRLATAKKTPEEIWESIVSYIDRGDELVDIMGSNNEPISEHTRTRTLAFIDRADRRAFMSDDPVQAAVGYAKQAIRQAEFVRVYGHGGSRLSSMKNEAITRYGATNDDIKLVNDYIDGLMGNKEVGMSRELKDLYGALTVYQNVRLLPFSIFSSLVDPLGVAVRSNSIGDAWNTFAYSLRNLFKEWKSEYTKDEWEQIAEDWGAIEAAGTTVNADNLYTGVTLRGTTKKINDAFFKYNLLNGWIRNNHIMAVKAAQKFMYRSSEDFFGEERSARYLEELGVSKDDIVYDADRERILMRAEELEAAGKSKEEAAEIEERLRQATLKFVRQAMLNPTAAELPNWASNPYLAPITHLKQFIWAFNATIVNRLAHEAQHGNFTPMLMAAAYVPGMIAADFMKDMVSGFGEEPPYKKDWDAVDYVQHGVMRSGLTGTGQFFVDVHEDVARGGAGYESFAGPSLEQMRKLLGALNSNDDTALYNWTVKALPANAIYDQALIQQ